MGTIETKRRFHELRAKGYSFYKIAIPVPVIMNMSEAAPLFFFIFILCFVFRYKD